MSTSNAFQPLQQLRHKLGQAIAYDDTRASKRGEHLAAAAAGGLLVLCALKTENRGHAVLEAVAGGLLLFRAAAGRDGLRRWSAQPSAPMSAGEGTNAL